MHLKANVSLSTRISDSQRYQGWTGDHSSPVDNGSREGVSGGTTTLHAARMLSNFQGHHGGAD